MIKAYLKRVLLFIPYVLCYFLALGIAMLALVMYASEFLFEDNTDSIATVACYVPDDEAYNRLGIGLVKQMDSVKHTIEIKQVSHPLCRGRSRLRYSHRKHLSLFP